MRESFELGRVLGRTFSVLTRRSFPILAVTLLAHAPLIALTFWAYGWGTEESQARIEWVLLGLELFIEPWAMAPITWIATESLRGRRAGPVESVRGSLRRILPVTGAYLLVSLCVLIGLVALVVPGLLLACALFVTVPVAVLERRGVSGSLRRSIELTRGFRRPVFGVLGLVIVSQLGIGIVIDLELSGTGLVYHAISALWGLVTTAFEATAGTLVYHRLRELREIPNADEVAAVFA